MNKVNYYELEDNSNLVVKVVEEEYSSQARIFSYNKRGNVKSKSTPKPIRKTDLTKYLERFKKAVTKEEIKVISNYFI